MTTCDVLIIGAGVFGTAIAARLARTRLKVVLIERAGDVAEGASKGNAGIASSYYSSPGTLEARMMTASVYRWDDVCAKLGVPYRRIGAVMPALSDVEAQALPSYCEEALGCGVRAEMLSTSEALHRESLLSSGVLGALYLPDEGVIDPMRLTWALAELAARNGVDVRFNSPVTAFEREGDRLIVASTPQGRIAADYVVNAAGLHADTVSRLAGGDSFRMWPRKGQYWVLDRAYGARLRHIIFAAPAIDTKGIHVVPTSRGSVLLGPTAEDGEDRYDHSTSVPMLDLALESARRLVPSLSLSHVIKSYAALRPASDDPFFVRFDSARPNLIHAVSRSIGVSTSLGVADYVAKLLAAKGLDLTDRPEAADAIPFGVGVRYAAEPERLNYGGWSDSQIVCVCEQVTVGEIEQALAARIPARSVDGVWKRTGAGGGRCQGALCLGGIIFLCSVHGGMPPERVRMKDNGEVGVGRCAPL